MRRVTFYSSSTTPNPDKPVVMEKKETEITAPFSAVAAATVLLSATLSLLWV